IPLKIEEVVDEVLFMAGEVPATYEAISMVKEVCEMVDKSSTTCEVVAVVEDVSATPKEVLTTCESTLTVEKAPTVAQSAAVELVEELSTIFEASPTTTPTTDKANAVVKEAIVQQATVVLAADKSFALVEEPRTTDQVFDAVKVFAAGVDEVLAEDEDALGFFVATANDVITRAKELQVGEAGAQAEDSLMCNKDIVKFKEVAPVDKDPTKMKGVAAADIGTSEFKSSIETACSSFVKCGAASDIVVTDAEEKVSDDNLAPTSNGDGTGRVMPASVDPTEPGSLDHYMLCTGGKELAGTAEFGETDLVYDVNIGSGPSDTAESIEIIGDKGKFITESTSSTKDTASTTPTPHISTGLFGFFRRIASSVLTPLGSLATSILTPLESVANEWTTWSYTAPPSRPEYVPFDPQVDLEYSTTPTPLELNGSISRTLSLGLAVGGICLGTFKVLCDGVKLSACVACSAVLVPVVIGSVLSLEFIRVS
ncbi:hypothetical protein HDU67_009694, partial [Dinochytrium kinnereticum]